MSAPGPVSEANATIPWRRIFALAALMLYFTGIGMLGGVIVERMRFDVERSRILAHQAALAERLHERLMALEPAGESGQVTR